MEEKICKHLPPSSNEEVSDPQLAPMVVDLTLAKTVSEKSIEPKKTEVLQLCPSLTPPHIKITTSIRASVNDYDKLYGGYADPNESLGMMKDGKPIVPDVQSWSSIPKLFLGPTPGRCFTLVLVNLQHLEVSPPRASQSSRLQSQLQSKKWKGARQNDCASMEGVKINFLFEHKTGLPPQGMPYINKIFSCGGWIEI